MMASSVFERKILVTAVVSYFFQVVVTNQITTRFVATGSSSGSAAFQDIDGTDAEPDEDDSSHVTAALGNTWSHAVNTRLIVQYLDEKFRQVELEVFSLARPFVVFFVCVKNSNVVKKVSIPSVLFFFLVVKQGFDFQVSCGSFCLVCVHNSCTRNSSAASRSSRSRLVHEENIARLVSVVSLKFAKKIQCSWLVWRFAFVSCLKSA